MARKSNLTRTNKLTNGTVASSTPVRNTAIPKPQASPAPKKIITHEMIAKRAYEISQSPQAGSDFDNWIRAEKELMGL